MRRDSAGGTTGGAGADGRTGGRSEERAAVVLWERGGEVPGEDEWMAGDGGSPKMSSKAMATDTKLKGESAHRTVVLLMGRVTEVQANVETGCDPQS